MEWSRRVRKLLNRYCDPTPNGRTSLISLGLKLRRRAPRLALRAKLVRTTVGIRFGVLGVAFDHQHRDRPNVDLSDHAEHALADQRFKLLDHKKLDFKFRSARHSFGLEPRG
jgi:hypothetical protein